MRIGFAGAGNMATALARGWAGAEDGPEAMLFCDAGLGTGGGARGARPAARRSNRSPSSAVAPTPWSWR